MGGLPYSERSTPHLGWAYVRMDVASIATKSEGVALFLTMYPANKHGIVAVAGGGGRD